MTDKTIVRYIATALLWVAMGTHAALAQLPVLETPPDLPSEALRSNALPGACGKQDKAHAETLAMLNETSVILGIGSVGLGSLKACVLQHVNEQFRTGDLGNDRFGVFVREPPFRFLGWLHFSKDRLVSVEKAWLEADDNSSRELVLRLVGALKPFASNRQRQAEVSVYELDERQHRVQKIVIKFAASKQIELSIYSGAVGSVNLRKVLITEVVSLPPRITTEIQ